jgi:hypothetical protein
MKYIVETRHSQSKRKFLKLKRDSEYISSGLKGPYLSDQT